MPDLLGATNPVPGYERNNVSTNVPTSPDNTQVRNVPDPSRVVRADDRAEQQDNASQGGKIRYDSNFHTFLQRLRDAPSLAESLSQLFAGRQGTVVTSGMSEGIAKEMSQVLQMLHMDEEQLTQFLSGQFQTATRFQGALFNLLRNAYGKATSENMRTDILQFAKSYSDYAATSHIEGNLLRNLARMADAMPESWGSRLRELTAELQNGISAGDRQGNVTLLQRSIIPFMSSYVDATHDMGLSRSLLSMMTLDLARYENGSTENLLQTFHQLNGYGTLNRQLGALDDESLLKLLEKGQFSQSTSASQFADHLTSAANLAMRGEGSAETQQIFQQLVSAMLINESVYMPINHFLLPLESDGKMLFSELWVDPDADKENTNTGSGGTMKFLFKVDVESLGLFDIMMTTQNRDVDLRISCPEKLESFTGEIASAMKEILTRNGLNAASVSVKKMERPVTLTEVFPRIFEGMNSVNVKV